MPNMKALSHRLKKTMANVKVFSRVGQRSRSRSHVKNLWFRRKGLVIRYTHIYIYIYSGKAHGIHYDVALLKYHIT